MYADMATDAEVFCVILMSKCLPIWVVSRRYGVNGLRAIRFRVWGLGFRVWCFGFWLWDWRMRFRVYAVNA